MFLAENQVIRAEFYLCSTIDYGRFIFVVFTLMLRNAFYSVCAMNDYIGVAVQKLHSCALVCTSVRMYS